MPNEKFRIPTRLLAIVILLGAAGASSAAPPNDACAGATPLTLNLPAAGTLSGATNDFQLTVASACYHGTDHSKSTAPGQDVVYSFVAPAAGPYSFRVQWTGGGWDPVLYVATSCPGGSPPQTVPDASCIDAANRQGYSSIWLATEETPCLPLTAGQQVFAFVDQTNTFIAGPFAIEVTRCHAESESNDAPSLANPFVCGIEGSVETAGDFDFFSLGAPPTGSRVFAIADALAGRTDNTVMRVTTASDTLEFDDSDNDNPFGPNSPNIEGRALTGTPAYLQVGMGGGSTPPSRPYRVYANVQPPGQGTGGSSAVAEAEPNNTRAQANVSPSLFFSGDLIFTSDTDYFRFCANKGDLVFLGLDGDPSRDASPIDPILYLYDDAGALLQSVDDTNRASSVAPGLGSLASTTPSSPGEGIWWRARKSGVYYAATNVSVAHGQALFGDYLLSISTNCKSGSQLVSDLTITKVGSPDPVEPGANVTYTVTVTNQGPDIAMDAVLADTLPLGASLVSVTPPPGWTCAAPAGSVSCATPCLEVGVPQTFTIVVASPPCSQGALTNLAAVSAATADPNGANNNASATVTRSCDDGNACTIDTCNPAGGCVHAALPDETPCDDGDVCTSGDACAGGICTGTTGPPPGEVAGFGFEADKATMFWTALSASPGLVYDVPRGLVSQLPVGAGPSEACVAPGGTTLASVADAATPPAGLAHWYLVRGRDSCGIGTYGSGHTNPGPPLNGPTRSTAVCP